MIALPCLLYSMDLTVLNLAIPRLTEALRPTGPQLLWIVDIYGFLLAGFLVPMGNLGDRIGRRKLLLMGAVVFGLASIAAAYSTTSTGLIAARAILGVAAATLAPSTLSLIRNMFLDPRQRTVAIGVWVTSFAAGTAIGPLLGGLLLERFWWGSVFLLAVPVVVLLLILAPLLLPEYRDPSPGGLDWMSAGLFLIGVLAMVYAIKEFARGGFQWLPAAGVLAGLGVSAAFVRRQMALANPLIDLRLFRLRGFSVALAMNLLALLAFDGAFLLIAQYLQLVAGLSPWEAALWTLPWAGGVIAGSMAGPFLVRWVRPRFVIVPGLVVAAGGFGLLTQVGAESGLVVIAVGSMLSSLGVGPAVSLSTDLVVGTVSAERAGVASGMTETSTELGGALGIAILGSVSIAVYRSALVVPSALPAGAAELAHDTLGGALAVAADLPAADGAALSAAARDAFTQGLHVSALVSTAVALGLAVVAFAMLEGKESDR